YVHGVDGSSVVLLGMAPVCFFPACTPRNSISVYSTRRRDVCAARCRAGIRASDSCPDRGGDHGCSPLVPDHTSPDRMGPPLPLYPGRRVAHVCKFCIPAPCPGVLCVAAHPWQDTVPIRRDAAIRLY